MTWDVALILGIDGLANGAVYLLAGLGLVRLVSDKAAGATTIMLVARLVPFTLVAPLAGAFVDRWSRRTVMTRAPPCVTRTLRPPCGARRASLRPA